MSEKRLRRNVLEILREAGLDAYPVENVVCPGMPDVNYVEGMIELKQLKAWPKRETTPVRIRHFTIGQKAWLAKRWAAGGNAYLLLEISKTFLLYNGNDVYKIGTLTEKQLRELAASVWEGLPALRKELPLCLKR